MIFKAVPIFSEKANSVTSTANLRGDKCSSTDLESVV